MEIIVLSVIAFLAFLIFKIFWEILKEKAPFIPTPIFTIKKIINEIEIKENDFVYDLGSGDGRFLFEAYFKNPSAFYVGIEKKFFPYLLSRIKLLFLKIKFKEIDKKIKFYRQDLLKSDLCKANLIYLYLSPAVLKILEPKLLKVLKRGTKIISCDFSFPSLKPLKIIELPHQKSLGKKVFIYQI